MKVGYLAVETHRERPGMVRLVVCDRSPDPEPTTHGERRLRYIARFDDAEAAMMHTHEILRRRLCDPDVHLYRVPFEQAIAAVESLGLKHRRIYLDADFSDDTKAAVSALCAQLRASRTRRDRFFDTVGYVAIGLLLFNMLVFSFA